MLAASELSYADIRALRARHAAEPINESFVDLPEGYPATIVLGSEHPAAEPNQIVYQRCGGGRRIIKKKLKD